MEFPSNQQYIHELREQVREYDRFYRLGKPIISDTEFDFLFRKLKQLESESGEPIPPDSPTQRPGSDLIEGGKRVKHQIPMLSIENVYNIGELKNFGSRAQKLLDVDIDATAWIVELKVDGCGLSLIYERGILTQGITRGKDGEGDDVTHNLDMIRDIPTRLKFPVNKIIPERLEVRGEVYMKNSDFTELYQLMYKELCIKLKREPSPAEEKKYLYRNPRNLTTGTLSLKDLNEIEERKEKNEVLKEHQRRNLHFFAHGVGSYEGAEITHWDFLQELQSYGIFITPHVQRFDSFAEAADYCEQLYENDDNFRSELDFEIDGLVLKLDRFDLREKLGATGHHPRWVIAYKVEKYEETTTLREIQVQVGKTGTITPVAELDPVEIDRTTVSRASLHNVEEIERKDIRVGDVVVVEKAGKIIPHIVRVEKHFRKEEIPTFEFPVRCPVCDTELTKDDGGVYIRCNNPLCPAQFKEKLKYFAGRNAMDIEGLGIELIEQLVDSKLVRNFGDLYRLTWEAIRSKNLERMKAKPKKPDEIPTLVKNLLDSIEKSKSRELPKFLNALSIRHVGNRTASILAKHFGSLQKLREASEEELSNIDEIGPTIAKSVFDFFRTETEMIDDLLASGQWSAASGQEVETPHSPLPTPHSPLSAQTIVVTGTLEHFKRNEIEEVIEKYGGRTSSSVSSKTSFVLVGADPGSKLAKAEKLGVRIVYEPEFLEMIGGKAGGK